MAIKVALPIGMESILKNRDDVVLDVRIGDYLNTEFLLLYTRFKDYDEFVEYSPYTEQELASNSDLFNTAKMDRYIDLTTQFDSFDSLFSFAVENKLNEMVNQKIYGDNYIE